MVFSTLRAVQLSHNLILEHFHHLKMKPNEYNKNPWVHIDINRQRREKRKLFLTVECQLINRRGMMELENLYEC